MKLHELPKSPVKHKRKRVGRGDGSGLGKTCGRGEKGQKSRSGAKHKPFFEGGQIPFFRRLPKRGFKSRSHKEYQIVNVQTLEKFFDADAVVDQAALIDKGIIPESPEPVKILANGEITKSLQIKAHKFSAAAKQKIEAAGGKCEVIE